MARGFVYLVAVMDWYSRRVLSWRLSNTLDTSFCTEALDEAISSKSLQAHIPEQVLAGLTLETSNQMQSHIMTLEDEESDG